MVFGFRVHFPTVLLQHWPFGPPLKLGMGPFGAPVLDRKGPFGNFGAQFEKWASKMSPFSQFVPLFRGRKIMNVGKCENPLKTPVDRPKNACCFDASVFLECASSLQKSAKYKNAFFKLATFMFRLCFPPFAGR